MLNTAKVKISIIIPNLNGCHFLKECLPSLQKQTRKDFELILIDNGSDDDSIEFTLNQFPQAIIHRFPKNEGFSKAVNQGIALANGEYIFLLNNDTQLAINCIEEIINFLDHNPTVSFGATKMLYAHNHQIINNVGDIFSIYGVASRRGNRELDEGQYEKIEPIMGACAGAAFYRRSLFSVVGGFDESFFAYIEDVDFSLRAQLLGHQCFYLPSAVVYHVDGGTSQKFKNFSFFLVARNSLYTVFKNFPTKILIITSPFWILGQVRNIINGLRFRSFGPIFRVYRDFIKNLKRLKQERRVIQRERKISNRAVCQLLSKKMNFDIKKIFYDFFPSRH